jgi:hypothetical protein
MPEKRISAPQWRLEGNRTPNPNKTQPHPLLVACQAASEQPTQSNHNTGTEIKPETPARCHPLRVTRASLHRTTVHPATPCDAKENQWK